MIYPSMICLQFDKYVSHLPHCREHSKQSGEIKFSCIKCTHVRLPESINKNCWTSGSPCLTIRPSNLDQFQKLNIAKSYSNSQPTPPNENQNHNQKGSENSLV